MSHDEQQPRRRERPIWSGSGELAPDDPRIARRPGDPAKLPVRTPKEEAAEDVGA